jgi:hypothetical protein
MRDKIIIVVLIAVIVLIIIYEYTTNTQENFGKHAVEFVRVGQVRYDLKGDPIRTHKVHNCYFDKRICYDNTFGNTEHNTDKNFRTLRA